MDHLIKFSNEKGLNTKSSIVQQTFCLMKVNLLTPKLHATVQKFYLNSSLTALKALWLLKTMNEKEKERNKIPEKTITFMSSVVRVFEFSKIRRERECFSLLNKTSDEYIDRLFDIVNIQKKIVGLKLFEFVRSYAHRNKNTRQIKGAIILQSYNNKMVSYAFTQLKKLIMDIRSAKSKKNTVLRIMLVYAQEKKIAIALKAVCSINNKWKHQQASLVKISKLFELKQTKLLKDSFAFVYLRSNILNKERNFKNVIYPLALQKINDCLTRHTDHLRALPFAIFKRIYLLNKKAKASVISSIIKNAKVKKSAALSGLLNLLYSPRAKQTITLTILFNNILKENYKFAFDRIKQESELAAYRVYYNYLWKCKLSALEAENYTFKEKSQAEMYQLKLRNALAFLDRIFKENRLRSLINGTRVLKERIMTRTIHNKKFENNKIIADTIKFTNFCKLLLKKSQIMKYKALCIWRDAKYTPRSIFNQQLTYIGEPNKAILRIYNSTRLNRLILMLSSMTMKRKRTAFGWIKKSNRHTDLLITKAILRAMASLVERAKIQTFHKIKRHTMLVSARGRNKKDTPIETEPNTRVLNTRSFLVGK